MKALPFLFLFAAIAGGDEPSEKPLVRDISPRVIGIGSFYDGAEVRVAGVANPGSQVIVVVVGSDAEARFNKMGRFGPIWLNSGRVRISGVPSLFLRFSGEPVEKLLSAEQIARHGLNEASLLKRMRTEPEGGGENDARVRADYLALKKARGLYVFDAHAVRLGDSAGGQTAFSISFSWPKKAPPDTYTLRAYEIRGGSVVREESAPIQVVRTGFPAWLAGVAEDRASLYGITAVLVGALAGFGIDFLTLQIFGKKRAGSH